MVTSLFPVYKNWHIINKLFFIIVFHLVNTLFLYSMRGLSILVMVEWWKRTKLVLLSCLNRFHPRLASLRWSHQHLLLPHRLLLFRLIRFIPFFNLFLFYISLFWLMNLAFQNLLVRNCKSKIDLFIL